MIHGGVKGDDQPTRESTEHLVNHFKKLKTQQQSRPEERKKGPAPLVRESSANGNAQQPDSKDPLLPRNPDYKDVGQPKFWVPQEAYQDFVGRIDSEDLAAFLQFQRDKETKSIEDFNKLNYGKSLCRIISIVLFDTFCSFFFGQGAVNTIRLMRGDEVRDESILDSMAANVWEYAGVSIPMLLNLASDDCSMNLPEEASNYARSKEPEVAENLKKLLKIFRIFSWLGYFGLASPDGAYTAQLLKPLIQYAFEKMGVPVDILNVLLKAANVGITVGVTTFLGIPYYDTYMTHKRVQHIKKFGEESNPLYSKKQHWVDVYVAGLRFLYPEFYRTFMTGYSTLLTVATTLDLPRDHWFTFTACFITMVSTAVEVPITRFLPVFKEVCKYQPTVNNLPELMQRIFRGYDLKLLTDGIKVLNEQQLKQQLKSGELYFAKDGDSLSYVVLDPMGNPAKGRLEAKDITGIEGLADLLKESTFSVDKLKPFLPQVLKITASRKHTFSDSSDLKEHYSKTEAILNSLLTVGVEGGLLGTAMHMLVPGADSSSVWKRAGHWAGVAIPPIITAIPSLLVDLKNFACKAIRADEEKRGVPEADSVVCVKQPPKTTLKKDEEGVIDESAMIKEIYDKKGDIFAKMVKAKIESSAVIRGSAKLMCGGARALRLLSQPQNWFAISQVLKFGWTFEVATVFGLYFGFRNAKNEYSVIVGDNEAVPASYSIRLWMEQQLPYAEWMRQHGYDDQAQNPGCCNCSSCCSGSTCCADSKVKRYLGALFRPLERMPIEYLEEASKKLFDSIGEAQRVDQAQQKEGRFAWLRKKCCSGGPSEKDNASVESEQRTQQDLESKAALTGDSAYSSLGAFDPKSGLETTLEVTESRAPAPQQSAAASNVANSPANNQGTLAALRSRLARAIARVGGSGSNTNESEALILEEGRSSLQLKLGSP